MQLNHALDAAGAEAAKAAISSFNTAFSDYSGTAGTDYFGLQYAKEKSADFNALVDIWKEARTEVDGKKGVIENADENIAAAQTAVETAQEAVGAVVGEGYTFVPAVAGVATAAKEGPSLFVFSGEALEINGFSADEDRQELDLLYIGDEEYELVEVDNAAAITGVAKDDALEIFVYKTEEDNTILAVEKSADSGVDGLTNITLVGVTEAVKFLGNLDDQFILIA